MLKKKNKYEGPYRGLYQITQPCKNGTVAIRRGAAQNRINIIWINPITNNNKIATVPVNFNRGGECSTHITLGLGKAHV